METGNSTQGEKTKMEVTETKDSVTVDTGAMRFELSNVGILRSLHTGEKALVAGNEEPLLSASVLESDVYDGWRDHAPGKIV